MAPNKFEIYIIAEELRAICEEAERFVIALTTFNADKFKSRGS